MFSGGGGKSVRGGGPARADYTGAANSQWGARQMKTGLDRFYGNQAPAPAGQQGYSRVSGMARPSRPPGYARPDRSNYARPDRSNYARPGGQRPTPPPTVSPPSSPAIMDRQAKMLRQGSGMRQRHRGVM